MKYCGEFVVSTGKNETWMCAASSLLHAVRVGANTNEEGRTFQRIMILFEKNLGTSI